MIFGTYVVNKNKLRTYKLQFGCGRTLDSGQYVVLTDQVKSLLINSSAGIEVLYIQYLHSAVRLLPYLGRHILWHEFPTHAYPALLLLYQMRFQLFIHAKQNKTTLTVFFSFSSIT